MKNTLQGINNGVDEQEDRIGDLENKVTENTQSEQQLQGYQHSHHWVPEERARN